MSTEFLTIYWRDMLRFVRFRIVLVASLIQPALWMALYGAAMSNNFSRLGSGMVVPAEPSPSPILLLWVRE